MCSQTCANNNNKKWSEVLFFSAFSRLHVGVTKKQTSEPGWKNLNITAFTAKSDLNGNQTEEALQVHVNFYQASELVPNMIKSACILKQWARYHESYACPESAATEQFLSQWPDDLRAGSAYNIVWIVEAPRPAIYTIIRMTRQWHTGIVTDHKNIRMRARIKLALWKWVTEETQLMFDWVPLFWWSQQVRVQTTVFWSGCADVGSG